eukprot:544273-Pleurochrysis_carterae.AAC.2
MSRDGSEQLFLSSRKRQPLEYLDWCLEVVIQDMTTGGACSCACVRVRARARTRASTCVRCLRGTSCRSTPLAAAAQTREKNVQGESTMSTTGLIVCNCPNMARSQRMGQQ